MSDLNICSEKKQKSYISTVYYVNIAELSQGRGSVGVRGSILVYLLVRATIIFTIFWEVFGVSPNFPFTTSETMHDYYF